MLEKQDLQAIREIVTTAIQETVPDMIQEGIRATVPDMIQEGIRATVPDMIDEKLDANTDVLLSVIEERVRESESNIVARLDIIEKYYQLNRLEASVQNDHARLIERLQDEMKEVKLHIGMA